MITVLVVDDSAFMRKAISMMLERDAEIEVVDTARDGEQALEKVERLQPDVVTMDIEMPRMDGITALKRIMSEMPRPVLMISSLTKEGADATVKAMEAGAVGFIPKQHSRVSLEITKIEKELTEKVKTAARSNVQVLQRSSRSAAAPSLSSQNAFAFLRARLIAIGISTGGPFALQKVIPELPADLPVPVVIVQHMPPHFTKSLAERLDKLSPLHVVEAEAGMPVEAGTVYIAPGAQHLTFRTGARTPFIRISEDPDDTLHRPSVNVMFASASTVFRRVLGVVMTGMGKDGLEGAQVIKDGGGKIIAQDEDTSVVYGMPRAVASAGLTDLVLPMERIAPALAEAVGTPSRRSSTVQ